MTVVARRLQESPRRGRRLGRHVEHDDRSRGYPARAAVGDLVAVEHRRHGAVLDQGDLGSCTGNALVGALMTEPLYRPHHNYTEHTALRVYELATRLDEFDGFYPPDDTGSSGLAVCKAAQQMGLIGEYGHAFGVDHALAALQLGPVITGVAWYEGFDRPTGDGLITVAGEVRGGHEFEVSAYLPDRQEPLESLLGCWQSWGPSYAKRGRFFMTVRTWATLLEQQGDVTVPTPKAAA